ncbi:MAG: glucose-1-phosphate thymidylyltransferase [Candidatus Methanomethylicia archaeon]
MKGVILHGGAGTRLRPLTFSGPKQLIPVANKPVSQYVLEDLRDAGIHDIAIILGETFPEMVREHYGDGGKFNVKVTYIFQGKPLGIAHAVNLCREFVGEESFVVYLGDNLIQNGVKKPLEKFLSEDFDAFILLKEVEDPTRFGVAEIDEKGKLIRLIEKPKIPPSKYAIIGIYFFKPVVFDVIKDLKPSWRGELEITDTLQLMIQRGYKVGYDVVDGWWLDTGKKDDILYANALILDERIKRDIKGEIVDSKVEGRVTIDEGAKIVNSTIRGPAIIGGNSLIENSYIGPYTSIGEEAKIINSEIDYCVILKGATIKGVERLRESLIGRYAMVMRNEDTVKTIKLNVGDYSEIIV